MPRNSSGVYTQPAATSAVSGATIDPDAFNTLISDLGNELTGSLPVNGSAGMTGPAKVANGTVSSPAVQFTSAASTGWYKTTDGIGIAVAGTKVAEFTASGALNGSGTSYSTAETVTVTTVASASTVTLADTASSNIVITGTTTISSFGAGTSGLRKFIRFNGIMQLTYGVSTIVLPTGGNITTADGDCCTAVCQGGSTWWVQDYQKFDGKPLVDNYAGTVTSVTAGAGLTGGAITTSGTIAIDTNNGFGVGSVALLENSTGGAVSASATASGASLKPVYFNAGVYDTAGTTSGTWRNISGINLSNGQAGLWIRTA